MKLHLPKALFTAVIAAFAVSQTVWGETDNLLKSSDNWAFTGRNPNPTYSSDTSSIVTTEDNWKQNLATYTMVGDRSFFSVVESFAVTITTTGNDGVLTLGFTGTEQTFVLGDLAYNGTTLGYGTTTDTTSYVYHNGTAWDAGATGNISSVNSMNVEYAAGTYEMLGTVTYTDGSYMLSMTINGTEYITDYNLGSTFDIDRITFGYDGESVATLSKLEITGEKEYMDGYYATTLAEGSTSAAAATWTNGSTGVNYADIAMKDGSAILDFTGAAAGSTVVLGAGTNVYAIDISGGSVTLQTESGKITTNELVVKSGATATVDADTTVAELNTSASSSLNVAANKTLTIASFSLNDSMTALSVADGAVLDLSSISLPDAANAESAMNLIKLINKTSGKGTIKLANAANYINSAANQYTMTFNTNYEVGTDSDASFHINSWHTSGQWITSTVTEHGSITVGGGAGVLELQSGQKLLIEGGSVAAGQLALGHTSPGAAYSGAVEMTSGSLTVGEIKAQNIGSDSWKNTILLTGGTLTITGSEAITYADTARTDSTLGGSGDSALILKTAGTDWSVSKGTTTGNSLTIGNITIDADNANMITIYDATIVGDIQNNAATDGAGLTLSGAFVIEGSTSVVDKVMTENGYGIRTTNIVIDNFKGDGNYVYADGMTINDVAITDYTQDGNTFTYSTGEQPTTIYHVVNGTVKMGEVSTTVTNAHTGYDVYSGATLEVNAENSGQVITLRGGATLSNTTADRCNQTGYNKQQIKEVYLTGDAKVNSQYNLGITASSWAQAQLDLAGHVLTKEGSALFSVTNANISAGTIDVKAGTLVLNNKSGGGTLAISDDLIVNIAQGASMKLWGDKTATFDGDFILNAKGTGTIDLNQNVNIGSAGGTSTFAGTISVNSNNLYLGNTASNVDNEMEAIDLSAATIALNGGTQVRYFGGNSTIGTLSVKQDGTLNVYATNKGADNPGKLTLNKVSIEADKTLSLTGHWESSVKIGVLTGTGSLTQTNGSNGTISYAIDAIEAGFGSITNAGNLTLGTASTTVNLGSTLTNTGTVTMLGALALSGNAYADFTVSGAQYDNTGDGVADDGAEDGYLKAAGSTSFTVVSGGTINKDDITSVTYNGETVSPDSLSIADNKLKLSTQVAITPTMDYYVNTTVDYSADSVVASDATTGIILNGGTLNLNTTLNTAATKGIVAAENSTIKIASDVTLNNSSVSSDGGTATITGEAGAVYAVSGGENPALNVTLGSDWKGTVKLSGVTMTNTDLSTYANGANSTIEFDGVSGYNQTGTCSYDFNIVLADKKDALIFNNGGNNDSRTFTGTITGSGNIVRENNKGSFQYYTFSGNISGWTGSFLGKNSDAGQETIITLNGSATTVNAGFKQQNTGGKLNVLVDNSADVTLSGDISATAGTIKLQNKGTGKVTASTVSAAGGTVQLSGTGSNTIEIGTLSIQGSNKVTDGQTSTKAPNVSPVTTDDAAVDVTITQKLVIDSTNAFSLSGALTLADTATVDLSGFTVDTTTAQDTYVFTLGTAAGGITTGESINFTAPTLEGYTATLAAMATVPTAESAVMLADDTATNNYLVLTLTKDSADTPLTQVTVNGVDVNSSSSTVLTLTTEQNAAGVVFGDTFNATMSDSQWNSILAELKNAGITPDDRIAISFVGADGKTFDFGDNGTLTTPTITINGVGTVGEQTLSGEGTAAGTIVGNYVTAYIPEPTTTTLSLLALAGLAVRRRRR